MSRTPKWKVEEDEFERLMVELQQEGVPGDFLTTSKVRMLLDRYVQDRVDRLMQARKARSKRKKSTPAGRKAAVAKVKPMEEPGIDPYLEGIMNRDGVNG